MLTLLTSGTSRAATFLTFARKGNDPNFLTVGIVQKRGVGLERLEPNECERAIKGNGSRAAARCAALRRKTREK